MSSKTQPGEPVERGEGGEAFTHNSWAPIVFAAGLLGIALGLSIWAPIRVNGEFADLTTGAMASLGLGAVLFIGGTWLWLKEYLVEEFEQALIPEQKRQLLNRPSGTLTVYLAILSEIVVFGALFAVLLYLDAVHGGFPPEGHTLDLGIALGLTALLVSSGIFLHYGEHKLRHGDRSTFKWATVIAFLLGTAFILGQLWEYNHFLEIGISPTADVPATAAFASAFYALTGMHGIHVLVGLLAMGAIIYRAFMKGHFSENRYLAVKVTTIYWHFVDAIWLVILVVVYIRYS